MYRLHGCRASHIEQLTASLFSAIVSNYQGNINQNHKTKNLFIKTTSKEIQHKNDVKLLLLRIFLKHFMIMGHYSVKV